MVELLLLSGAVRAEETALSIRSLSAMDTAADRVGEDTWETTTRIAASAKGGQDTRWFLGVLGEHTLRIGADTEAFMGVRADESGIDAPLGAQARVRAGYLVERWGGLDLLPVVDVINGRDLRAGLLTPPQHLRLPAAMARLQVGGTKGRAELTWLPVPARDVGSLLESDWALIRQGWLSDLAADAATWSGDPLTESYTQQGVSALGEALSALDPWTTAGLSQLSAVSGLPQATGAGGDVFLRLEGSGRRADGALLGGLMTARQPAISVDATLMRYIQEERLPGITDQEELLSAVSDPVQQVTPRSLVAGAEASGLLGPVGVRAEGLWMSQTAVSRQWLQASTSPAIAAGAGLDWARGTVLVKAEGSWRRLLEPPEDPWLTRADQVQLGGAVVGRLLAERMTVQLGGVYDLSFSEHLMRAALSWRASDTIELTGGLLLLGGGKAPASFIEAMTTDRGPLGYWGDNDCITIEMAFIR